MAIGSSVWQQGATACREEVSPDANPYEPKDYNWLVWMNGWCHAYHEMSKEPVKQLFPSPQQQLT